MADAERIAVLTGAGVSAPSGIATFRGAGGVWNHAELLRLASPEGYRDDPVAVWRWYAERLDTVLAAAPNPAHLALAALERRTPLTLVTQNVDGLHRRAGSGELVELHGDLTRSRCERCGHLDELVPPLDLPPHCSICGHRARPNVVWFGELLPAVALERATRAFANCDVALVVGTSGTVQPAASLIGLAGEAGAVTIEINPETTPLSRRVDLSLRLGAVEGLAEVVV